MQYPHANDSIPQFAGGADDWEEMMEFEKPNYSKKEVVEAGKSLKGAIRSVDADALRVFRIAHNWRSSYVRPMYVVRQELLGKVRKIDGAATAARLKRMQSIRRKLKKTPLTLYQIQDIGGCRAIVDSVQEARALLQRYKDGDSRHHPIREDNYVLEPKRDGYRSFHLVLKFNGDGPDEIYNRQTIELQIRTRLQHAWSTAVESVGLVRNENLKHGEGDTDWLRLFQIMAAEFAIEEKCPLVAQVSENAKERRKELKDLDRRLKAAESLDSYRHVINFVDRAYTRSNRFFLLTYYHDKKMVTIRPFISFREGTTNLENAELKDESSSGVNTVLVQAEKVEDLKAAFPNYFLDVKLFAQRLHAVLQGRQIRPIKSTPVKSAPALDHSWVREYGKR